MVLTTVCNGTVIYTTRGIYKTEHLLRFDVVVKIRFSSTNDIYLYLLIVSNLYGKCNFSIDKTCRLERYSCLELENHRLFKTAAQLLFK